jgi:iron(III) transport system permease protein
VAVTSEPYRGEKLPAIARRSSRLDPLTLAALAIAAMVAAPVVIVFAHFFLPSEGAWTHLASTTLPAQIANTVLLTSGVAIGCVVIGVAAAWLITMCRFPGDRFFEWAMLLPMAMPAYIMAYADTNLLQFAGPVQTALRELMGWRRGDYWFPEIQSLGGAIAILTLALYPYVYLLARAAFLEQSVCAIEVARTLGHGPWATFFRVALPLARPAIAGGAALALMEAAADFGTVQYFGVDTFTTGIYRTWFGMGNKVAAAQLAATLMLFVFLILAAERLSRGEARYHHTSRRYSRIVPVRLHRFYAAGAVLICTLPLLLGFAMPVATLLDMSFHGGDPLFGGRFLDYARNSAILAGLAAVITVAAALVIAYGLRMRPSPMTRGAARVASMGYAIPGSVIAVGMVIPLATIDNFIDGVMRSGFGIGTGLLLSGTIMAVLFAYVARFLAIGLNAVESGLSRVTPSMDEAARTLGAGSLGTLARVHIPILRGSMLTAAILVFVEVLKELPATLIVRPFNFDTLAIRVYNLASDERLTEASTGALTIIAVGLIPVVILSLMITRSRPGGRGDA